MKVSELDFFLPSELLAREPRETRGESRSDSKLMVMNRKTQTIEHKKFNDVIDYLEKGDVLVLNNSKVINANLIGWLGYKERKIKIDLAGILDNGNWQIYIDDNEINPGDTCEFGDGMLTGTFEKMEENHVWQIKFNQDNVIELANKIGRPIMSPDVKKQYDLSYYQNVYASKEGSAELPSAGRHFTKELLEKIKKKGVRVVYVTLHTGLSSMMVTEDTFEEHHMHKEYIEITSAVANTINEARKNGHSIVCVGTTVVRTLETVADEQGNLKPFTGYSTLYIYPGYHFKIVDKFITNFHGPNTSRIAMAAAFTGKDLLLKGYAEAIQRKYLFYEFGDTTLTI